jgi:hypothetical protein
MDTTVDTAKHQLTMEDRKLGTKARWAGYEKIALNCEVCGKEFSRPPSVIKKGKGKYCSQSCANGKPRSIDKQLKSNGYVYVKTYEHPFRSKQNLVAEHRIVVENAIGRFLTKEEVPHHIDENKSHNELYNLFLCRDDQEHRRVHAVDKVFLRMFNVARYQYWREFSSFDITKNRQDQLQEMWAIHEYGNERANNWTTFVLDQFSYWVLSGNAGLSTLDVSMEQLWLAFVMKELHNKVWSGTDWIAE